MTDLKQWIDTEPQETQVEHYAKMMKYKYGVKTLYAKIIKVLETHPDGFSINELAQILEERESTISARINELRKRRIVIFIEYRDSFVSGVKNMIWGINDNHKELVELIE